MLLRDYLARYNRTHDIQASTLTHYEWVLRSLANQGGPTHTSELTAAAINDYLIRLRDLGRSPWTIKQRRISILVIWRAAWREKLAPPILDDVRRLRPCHYAPTAWTVEEVRILIATAEHHPVRSLWTASLIRTGYDTGLRLGDLLAIGVGQIATNLLAIIQHKTGRPVAVQLRPETVAAIAEHVKGRQGSDLVWPLWGRREAFYRHFTRVVRLAAIRPGTFRWLRRSAATQLERIEPGRGTELLGHASRSTTETWYIDRAQLTVPPLPPL